MPTENRPAVASSTKPTTSTQNSAVNAAPTLLLTSARSARSAVPSGCRRGRASGSRGVAVGHRQHQPGAGRLRRAQVGLGGIGADRVSPQTMWSLLTSSRRATYRVRPASRTWLGAGSPSAAATNDGAAIADSDSTAQSVKNVRIRSPRPVLKIAMTSRRSGLISWARSAA